jgi:hypothetical protein
MPGSRRLVSWIGHADLLAMANELSSAEKDRVLAALHVRANSEAKTGPIKTLLENQAFEDIHFLSNYQPFLAEWFIRWLGNDAHIHQVEIAAPTDYASIFRAVDATLASVVKQSAKPDAELCIHLSPGSPAMIAIWVLLGKSRYSTRGTSMRSIGTPESRCDRVSGPFDPGPRAARSGGGATTRDAGDRHVVRRVSRRNTSPPRWAKTWAKSTVPDRSER